MTRTTALDVRDIRKSFGTAPAVDGVTFTVAEGETLAIIGPNGAGKSTLFGVVAGEHRPDQGHVLMHDVDVTRHTPAQRCRAGLSRTFQVASFFATRTVRENVQLAWSSRYRSASWFDRFAGGTERREQRVDEMLDQLDLMDLQNAQGGILAQGDRKRLELAMALVPDPQVLLLDEPTAGMSNADIERTIALLREVKQQNPLLTVVVTAHDMDVVFGVAERVILMGQGRLLVDGTPAEVESHPTTRDLYLGSEVTA